MTKSITGGQLDREFRTEEQDEHDLLARRSALLSILDRAERHRMTAVELVDVVDLLGLEAELDELVAGNPERHQRLVEARLASIELQERAADLLE